MRELSERDAELARARKGRRSTSASRRSRPWLPAQHTSWPPPLDDRGRQQGARAPPALHASSEEIADARLFRKSRTLPRDLESNGRRRRRATRRRAAPPHSPRFDRDRLEDLPGSERVHVSIAPDAEDAALLVLPRLAQALRSLLKNALDASRADASVNLYVTRADGDWRLEVEDSGAGMSPEVEAHAVEPFFTTKPTGQGMGLGLFLSKSVAEQHGGRLEIRSSAGQGTRAALLVPETPPATICRSPAHA